MDETIGFTVKLKDSASSEAKRIASALEGIGTSLRRIVTAGERSRRKVTRSLKSMAEQAKRTAAAFSSVSLALNDTARQLTVVTALTVGVVGALAAAGIKSAAETEASNARLDFALAKIGKNAEETKKRIDEVSLKTVLTRREISDMVTGLAIQRVDAFHSGLDDLFVTMQDGSRKSVSAVEVMNDAVAFSGKNAQRIMRGVREAVSERKIRTGRWLSEDLEIAGAELKLWNSALKAAKSPQEAFNALLDLMAKRVGGVTKSVELTLNHVLQQIVDWRDKLAHELFSGALPVIAQFLREMGEKFIEMTQANYFEPIRDAITSTVRGLVFLAKGLAFVGGVILDFVRMFPIVVPLLTALAGVLTLVTGALVAVAAVMAPLLAFGALGALLPTILIGLKSVAIVLVVISGALLIISPLIAGFAAMFAAIGAGVTKAQGVTDFFERLSLLVSAVSEGIRNLKGDTTRLSLETTAALEKAGLVDRFQQLMKIFVNMKDFFEGFVQVFKIGWQGMVQAMRPAIESFFQLADRMGVAFSLDPSEKAREWKGMGMALGQVVSSLGIAIAQMISGVIIMINALAAKLANLGVLSTDEYARILGAPKEFFELPEHAKKDLLEFGTLVSRGGIGDMLTPRAHRVVPKELIQQPVFDAVPGLKKSMDWIQKTKFEKRDADVTAIMAALGGGTAMAAVAQPAATISGLAPAQQQLAREAVSDVKITESEAKMLAKHLGPSLAKAIKDNPAKYKIQLDREALVDAVEEGANVSVEAAN